MSEINRRCLRIVLTWIVLAVSSTARADRPERPNIVFIMADDLGYGDLGCYGQQLIKTPNIDRLAELGMRFTQAYAGGPVCTSSRAVLMTGLHNGHSPARDNIPHYATYLNDQHVTLADVLHGAGYQTAGVGKWSLGDAGTVGSAMRQGFDHWFGYLNQDHAHYYYPEYLDDDDGRLLLAGNMQDKDRYSHHLLVDRALQFIGSAAKVDRPFFLYAAFTLPHFSSRREDVDRLSVPTTDPYTTKPWDEASRKYAAMVNLLDRDIGAITDVIDSLGLADTTLIIVTSDNGGNESFVNRFNSSGPLRGSKRDLTEGGIRVPFVARWPGHIPDRSVSNQVIAFQDMLPTVAELAQADNLPPTDGVSIVGTLGAEDRIASRPYLYWDYGHCRDRYDQAIRWKDWKAIREGQGNDLQLYDLSSDIGEEHNVAMNHPEVLQRMAGMMESAVDPHERYPIGTIYDGKPIWRP